MEGRGRKRKGRLGEGGDAPPTAIPGSAHGSYNYFLTTMKVVSYFYNYFAANSDFRFSK